MTYSSHYFYNLPVKETYEGANAFLHYKLFEYLNLPSLNLNLYRLRGQDRVELKEHIFSHPYISIYSLWFDKEPTILIFFYLTQPTDYESPIGTQTYITDEARLRDMIEYLYGLVASWEVINAQDILEQIGGYRLGEE